MWLILGLVIGVAGWWIFDWAKAHQIKVMWYEWLLEAIALLFALFAIQNFFASFEELEPNAAWVLLALFGVPALILAGVAGFLIWRRHKSVNRIAQP